MTMTRADRYQHLIVNPEAGEKRLFVHGPDRIVVSADGQAVHFYRSPHWEIAFIRNDGWTLGATKEFEHVAYRMWHTDWLAFMRPGEREATPISEYRPPAKAQKTCPRCGSPCEFRFVGRWDELKRWVCSCCTWNEVDK